MTSAYNEKLGRICDFISENLDHDLSLENLSKIAGISKFHFHRLFAIHTGVNLHAYIQLSRLKRASYQLVFHKEIKIIDIALDARFESPEAFSRAFKKTFNVTPTRFRENPDWEAWHEKYKFNYLTGEKEMEVKVITFIETDIAVYEHKGAPERLNDSIPHFIEWRKSTDLSPKGETRTFGIIYNDPNNTPKEEFRFDICGELKEDLPVGEKRVIQKTIPEGKCAVIRHTGSHDKMGEKVYYLYREWLPENNKIIRDFPLYVQYHNFFPETPENELITDIFLPIE